MSEQNPNSNLAAAVGPVDSASAVETPMPLRSRPNWANWILLVGLLGVLAYMQWRGTFSPMPPVFEERLSLQQGSERSTRSGKLVIAYGSASWCGPCQTYKRTTLVDAGVVAWIRRHAEPVYVNVDRQQVEAQQLGITSIPVTILLKDGKEIARLNGAATAEEFMEWVRPWTPLAEQ